MSSFLRMFEIAESRHRILNPITLDKLMLVGQIVELSPESRVLDLACGKAEMLSQWAVRFGISGHGVDLSDEFLAAATARAEELGVADRLTFSLGDAAEFTTDERFDVVSCIGAAWFGGGVEGSLELMRGWGKPGATLVLGEPYWAREPSAEAVEACGDGFVSLAETVVRLQAVGFDVVEMVLADGDSWDRYSAAQWQTLYRWIIANPMDPDVERAKERLVTSRRNHLEFQRDYLGWGIFILYPALAP